MKRYLLFSGSYYYPYGGIRDFKGDFENLQEVQNKVERLYKEEKHLVRMGYFWTHVYDSQAKKTIELNFKDKYEK